MIKDYRICTQCVMDTSDPKIEFDENGVCNHCREYEERVRRELLEAGAREEYHERLIKTIKERGKNEKYDCLIGVSGGVDSTMVAYLTREWGLRPLAIHMDNGWNSELAVANVARVLKKLDIDLITHVVNWEEFQDLHLAFLRASVANVEVPTDHAITAILFRMAAKHNIRYILSGSNVVTEAILPDSWHRLYEAFDWKYIRAIHRSFGKVKLRNYPFFTLMQFFYWIFLKRIRFVSVLNYIDYVKKDAKKLLEQEFGWRDYGGKHYESIFTRFFQAYILPVKFGIDKRRAHLSTLVCSGQMDRQEALDELKKEPYPPDKLQEDKEYVIKKLGISGQEFESIMAQPIKTHRDYPASELLLYRMPSLIALIKKIAKSW